jgi:hypothetical protein
MHAVDWAWTIQTEGRNWAGNQQIAIGATRLRRLLRDGTPDAIWMFMDLKLHHWGHKKFVLATRAMAARYGWGFKRFWPARDALVRLGVIKMVADATSTQPAVYAWGCIQNEYQY